LEDAPVTALALRGLRKSFGGLPATDDVTLEIARGERRLIIGPNGAGKTTLFNLISGDLEPDAGSVLLFGEEVAHLRPDQRAQRGLARTYQIITLFPKSTLVENIVLALMGLSPLRWHCWHGLAGRRDLYDQARNVLERVGLAQLAARRVADVSYGEKRRVEIAMALAQQPRLLLLDEPLAGLSAEERRTVQDLLEAIPRDISIVMIEHDMDTALAFAEKITVLHYGKVIVEGDRAHVVAHPRTREVYLGA
jgi:branched-chain amino acid transport system ATP-binding protein